MLISPKIIVMHLLYLVFVCLFCCTTANAKPVVPVPDNIKGATTVTAEQLIALAGRFPSLVIVDSRIREDRQEGYIENSHSLPDEETNCTTLAPLIANKTTPVLFYCNGIKCGRSVRAVHIALNCGYEKIYWFRGGFEEWKDKKYLYVK